MLILWCPGITASLSLGSYFKLVYAKLHLVLPCYVYGECRIFAIISSHHQIAPYPVCN